MPNLNSYPTERAAVRLSVRFPRAIVAGAALGVCAAAAQAQPTAKVTTASDNAPLMEQVVVTATRTPTKLDETLADVRVITQEQISNSAGRSLAEVLQRFAGVQMSSNGGRGNVQGIHIRGSKQVILLVDGVRFGSATAGDISLQQLPLENIERIEVVHGPASALYGSDAIGGVIQVFTKQGKGANKPFMPYGSATWGSAGYKEANGGFSGAQSGWNYSLNVARVLDPGFSATSSKSGQFHPDVDKFNQTSVSAALGYAFNADWRVDGNLMRADSFADSDSGLNQLQWADMQAGTAQLKLSGKFTDGWKTSFSVSRSSDKQYSKDWYIASGLLDTSLFQTEQDEYKWGNEIQTPFGVVIAGLERLEQKVTSTTKYDRTERTTDAVYAGLNGNLGAHSWQVNVRRDDNSQFGNFNTWGLGYGYQILPQLRVYASRGKSINAPTFNQLYWPADPMWGGGGNPDLKPEESKSTELGLKWSLAGHDFRLARFDNKVRNLISGFPAINVDRARLKGWSLGYQAAWDGWQLAASYEHLDARDGQGVRLTRRLPKQQATISLDKTLGAWKFGANALYVGKRTDLFGYPSRNVNLPSYTTLDIYTEYQLTRDLALQARVANLTDKAYETAYGYNQRGRMGLLTLKWAMR